MDVSPCRHAGVWRWGPASSCPPRCAHAWQRRRRAPALVRCQTRRGQRRVLATPACSPRGADICQVGGPGSSTSTDRQGEVPQTGGHGRCGWVAGLRRRARWHQVGLSAVQALRAPQTVRRRCAGLERRSRAMAGRPRLHTCSHTPRAPRAGPACIGLARGLSLPDGGRRRHLAGGPSGIMRGAGPRRCAPVRAPQTTCAATT